MRRYGDPILRQKATPVASLTPAITTILEDMVETMFQQVGIGLAAPQVGIPLRLIVMDDGKRGARALVNPVIIERAGAVRAEEGCLSLPGIFAEVERSESVRVE
ncbi:MAG: peptide deformylase, partial [Candidatus Rokubacteria bacterium GWC2_70_24]